MATARDELISFQQFAERQLQTRGNASLDELFMEWHDLRCPDEIDAAIRRGLADVDAGRFEPADQAMKQIARDFGFPNE